MTLRRTLRISSDFEHHYIYRYIIIDCVGILNYYVVVAGCCETLCHLRYLYHPNTKEKYNSLVLFYILVRTNLTLFHWKPLLFGTLYKDSGPCMVILCSQFTNYQQKMNDYESIYNFRYRIDHRICIVLCDHNNNGSKREIQERRRT